MKMISWKNWTWNLLIGIFNVDDVKYIIFIVYVIPILETINLQTKIVK